MAVLEHIGITWIIHKVEKLFHDRFLWYRIYRPHDLVRISFAAILRIRSEDRYILIQNLHRPEVFAPIGGVFKHYENARPFLDEIAFRCENRHGASDMCNDLRGYLPRGQLHRLVAWFEKNEDRESDGECIKRELQEELQEVGFALDVPSQLEFRRVRIKSEGPKKVAGLACKQYRLIHVLEATGPESGKELFSKLFEAAPSSERIETVTNQDIVRCRTRNRKSIAHHTEYLIGDTSQHAEERPL